MTMPSKNPPTPKPTTKTQTRKPPKILKVDPNLEGVLHKLRPSDPGYEEQWKRHWLKVAEASPGSPQACEYLGTTLAEYFRRRKADAKFDADCLIADQLIELRIIEKIREQSQIGDLRAQQLYFKSARRDAFDPAFPSWNPTPRPDSPTGSLPSEIADAMIQAGLAAAEKRKKPPLPDDPSSPPKPADSSDAK
jgi:hypothetical protein